MKLLYATFVSHLTYASDVIQYSVSQLQPLGVALNDCIRRIFTYNFYSKCESVRYLRLRLGYLSLTEIFETTTTTTTTITITTTTTTERSLSLPPTLQRGNYSVIHSHIHSSIHSLKKWQTQHAGTSSRSVDSITDIWRQLDIKKISRRSKSTCVFSLYSDMISLPRNNTVYDYRAFVRPNVVAHRLPPRHVRTGRQFPNFDVVASEVG